MGVPQGGVLSPLLFSVFINTLVSILNFSSYHLYADDLQLYISFNAENALDSILKLNRDLEAIRIWTVNHGLLVNPSKTQVMLIGRPRQVSKLDLNSLPPVIFNNLNLPYTTQVKNLGLYISQGLSWSFHVGEISRKVFASMHALKRMQNMLPPKAKLVLVNSLLLPLIDYADICYTDLTEELLNKLDRLLNLCIRYIFGLLLWHLLTISRTAKILAVLPAPVLSHQIVFRVLTQELAKRGHEVTIITALPLYPKDQMPVNYTEITVDEKVNDVMKHLLTEEIKISEDLVSQFVRTFKAANHITEGILDQKDVQNLLREKRTYFDLIFLEDCGKSLLVFSHLLKAPVIQISSFGGTFDTFEAVGALTHPILYPLAVRKRYHNLSAWEKISELLLQYRVQKAYNEAEILDNELMKKHFGRNTPTLHELKRNIHMLFLNIHPIWDSNRPVPSNVIYLGGLHQKPQQELPKELKSNLDTSLNGIIYVSFGTNVNPGLLPPEKLQIFINVFSKLPYDVYWKWNDENLPGLTKNIKVLKWFPQADLLQHPKVKLFITQGGLQSTDEAIAGGVPLIGIPFIWDQWFNVEKYVQLKIGLQLDINSITETKLRDSIETILGDKRYKENIIKLQSVMHDQPQSPLEKAVWWTEYVIRHRGAEHLRAPTANMDWMEYYEIKLILYIAIPLILLLAIIVLLISRLFVGSFGIYPSSENILKLTRFHDNDESNFPTNFRMSSVINGKEKFMEKLGVIE
nr:UDP-glucuronosyltransferase 2C1-like [Maniola hyperantus]